MIIPDTFAHECQSFIRARFTAANLDVTLSTEPPLVRGPYTTDGFRCPHGITYFAEPTGEQIAYFAENNVM